MRVSTTNEVAGDEVSAVLGDVMGLAVRSRNLISQLGARFEARAGGTRAEICGDGTAVVIEPTG